MKKKLLLADDEQVLVGALKERFEDDGYTVVTAFDGEECLEKTNLENPDLIIMDVVMPKLDGYSIIKVMQQNDATRDIPIIMLTGRDQMEDIFRMEGVKEYVIKPFDYEALRDMVKKIFKDQKNSP